MTTTLSTVHDDVKTTKTMPTTLAMTANEDSSINQGYVDDDDDKKLRSTDDV